MKEGTLCAVMLHGLTSMWNNKQTQDEQLKTRKEALDGSVANDNK